MWRDVVVHVNPAIGGKLDSLFDIHGLMRRSLVDRHGVRVENGRPKQGATLFGHDGNVQLRKIGPTPCCHITEIQKESQDAGPTISISLMGNEAPKIPSMTRTSKEEEEERRRFRTNEEEDKRRPYEEQEEEE